MSLVEYLTRPFKKDAPVECDHVYFPVPDGNGWYKGQECALCGKFNTMLDLGLQEENPYACR